MDSGLSPVYRVAYAMEIRIISGALAKKVGYRDKLLNEIQWERFYTRSCGMKQLIGNFGFDLVQ